MSLIYCKIENSDRIKTFKNTYFIVNLIATLCFYFWMKLASEVVLET